VALNPADFLIVVNHQRTVIAPGSFARLHKASNYSTGAPFQTKMACTPRQCLSLMLFVGPTTGAGSAVG
jgi:hypothetical protein